MLRAVKFASQADFLNLIHILQFPLLNPSLVANVILASLSRVLFSRGVFGRSSHTWSLEVTADPARLLDCDAPISTRFFEPTMQTQR